MDEAAKSMIRNLEAKTGKTIDQLAQLVRKSGLAKHIDQVAFLKEKHGMTHGYANLVVLYAKGHPATRESPQSEYSPDDWFVGKEALKPIYESLVAAVSDMADDIEWAPKKSYMSVRRSKQFAIIQPSTKTRLDLGLKLPGEPTTQRLEASGSFNSMVSHRVRISSMAEVDAELLAWVQDAYRQA